MSASNLKWPCSIQNEDGMDLFKNESSYYIFPPVPVVVDCCLPFLNRGKNTWRFCVHIVNARNPSAVGNQKK